MLKPLLILKHAELHTIASHLAWSRHDLRTLSIAQPHIWAEQLAQLARLHAHAQSLSLQFSALVREAETKMRRG